jgi:hypothetical protein
LEVYDLPGGMMQADADKLLKDLVTSEHNKIRYNISSLKKPKQTRLRLFHSIGAFN